MKEHKSSVRPVLLVDSARTEANLLAKGGEDGAT